PANPTVAKASGQLLSPDFFGPSTAWMVARATDAALLRFDVTVELGTPVLSLYSLTGEKFHDRHDTRFGRPTHARTDGSPILVELSTGSMATLGWEVSASALPMPARLDVEPNDVGSTAGDLGALPAATLGSLADTEIDMYKFTLDEPLPAGQAISIYVE